MRPFQPRGNPELIFPGNYRIGHGGEANTWPVDENGTLLSVYENNKFGGDKSYHIVGKPEGFYAAYWHELNFGGGHYASYEEKLRNKFYGHRLVLVEFGKIYWQIPMGNILNYSQVGYLIKLQGQAPERRSSILDSNLILLMFLKNSGIRY